MDDILPPDQERLESVGRLAAGVAHDVNNQLTVVMGYTGLLAQSLDPESSHARFAARIAQAAESTRLLVNRLLAFGRRQILAPEPVDLGALCERALPSVGARFSPNQLVTDLAPNVWAKVDKTQFKVVLSLLLDNALAAITPPDGQVTISVSQAEFDLGEARSLHASFFPGAYAVLRVQDNGQGMDEITASRAFDPFFTTQPGRTGLGLSVVFGVIKQSGGWVWLQSTPGEGTCVTIHLPLVEGKGRRSSHNKILSDLGVRPRVLLVDDDPLVLEFVETCLLDMGYEVETAEDSAGALALLESEPDRFGMFLTDVVLNDGVNGVELSHRVLERAPDLPVLFISGQTREHLFPDRLKDLKVNFLPKPFTQQDLHLAIQSCL